MSKKRKKALTIIGATIVLLVGIIIGVSASNLNSKEIINRIEKEIESEEKLDKTQLAIKINSKVIFDTKTSYGIADISNNGRNNYDFIVKIYTKMKNELIYTSPILKPGEKLSKIKLDKLLKNGKHSCVAYFEAYDETDKMVGKSGAEITIEIKK